MKLVVKSFFFPNHKNEKLILNFFTSYFNTIYTLFYEMIIQILFLE